MYRIFLFLILSHSVLFADLRLQDIDPANPEKVASFIHSSFSASSSDDSAIKIERFPGLSIWSSMYKVTNEHTSEIIAMRVLGKNQPQADKEKELFLIETMSNLGIAPKCLQLDHSLGMVSGAYIESPEARPWHPTCMTPNKIIQLASVIKVVHEQPLETIATTKFDELDEKVLALAESHPQFELFKIAIAKMREINSLQMPHISYTFCHNDLGHGGNTLWDGKRVWVIDWELAGYFNPYFDVCSPMVLLFFSQEYKDLFFETYLGRPPTQKEKHLLFINQQYAYLRYGVTSLGICHDPVNAWTQTAAEIEEIGVWTDILTGKVQLKREEMQTDFGRCKTGILLIKEALKNMNSEEFAVAISQL